MQDDRVVAVTPSSDRSACAAASSWDYDGPNRTSTAGVATVIRSVAEIGSRQAVKTPKTAAGTREVALPSGVIPELRRHLAIYAEPARDGRVFIGPRGATPYRSTFHPVRARAADGAVLSGVHRHDLRHAGTGDVVIIGIDPHKASVTIEARDTREILRATVTCPTTAAGHAAMVKVARRWPRRVWAVEGARGVGRALVARLVASGERVVDVPANLSARSRV